MINQLHYAFAAFAAASSLIASAWHGAAWRRHADGEAATTEEVMTSGQGAGGGPDIGAILQDHAGAQEVMPETTQDAAAKICRDLVDFI